MASIRENLLIRDYDDTIGQVKLSVDFEKISIGMGEKKKFKTCLVDENMNQIPKNTRFQPNPNNTQSINWELEQRIANPNMIETEVILDKTTKSQLTPKFIKSKLSSQSQSQSQWANLVDQIEKLYGYKNPSEFDFDLAKQLVNKFSTQLLNDYEKYLHESIVSECCLFAPRMNCTYNNSSRPFRFVNEMVQLMYVGTKRASSFENGKIRYTQLISRLSKKYISQYTKNFLDSNKYKLFRLIEHDKKNWDLLKSKPLSQVITNPTAMPVEVAPLEELEPFFKYLDSNAQPIENDDEYEPCMKFIRGALYRDKRMDLCKQVVGPNWIGMLMNSLKSNTQVEHFLLGNNIIGEEGGKAIGEFLSNPHEPKIKTWYLAGNDLGCEGIKWVVDGLIGDTDCVNLWLKRNPLKPQGIIHIARLLKSNSSIKILDLHNTAVFDEGLEYLVEGLKENRTLRHLYLDANGITANGIGYLVNYFEYLISNNLEGISSLWLDMNNIGDEGISKLVDVLGKYKYLKRLNIGSTGITEKTIPNICGAFKSHPNLIVLDLGMYKSTSDMGMITNNIGDVGIELLGELIKTNKSIQFLSVCMNGISQMGIETLAQAIQSSNTLMYLDYAQYGVDVEQKTFTQIKNKLESNKTNSGFTRKLRNVKHGEQIHWIDSIYRNNMK